MGTKVPLQVYIDRVLWRRLRKAAQRQATSQAALVRQFIEQGLIRETPAEADPAMGIIAIGHSGIKDLGVRHDDHLADLYRDTHRQSGARRELRAAAPRIGDQPGAPLA
jgi:hypothetical protein